jgi:hypothetical protein
MRLGETGTGDANGTVYNPSEAGEGFGLSLAFVPTARSYAALALIGETPAKAAPPQDVFPAFEETFVRPPGDGEDRHTRP